MQKTGQIDLPLHTGKTPRWLFEKMVVLSRCICEAIIIEFGRDYFLKNFADPFWFQSLGCALGFDWHSSGLTTTTCAALKEGARDLEDYGIYFCGGKGATSLKTPHEITEISSKIGEDPSALIYASKLTAKIDNNALQDGFSLYHHSFIFTAKGQWAVVQQGMSNSQDGRRGWARRYHWHSQGFSSFVEDPHEGIISRKSFLTLNLVDKDAGASRDIITSLAGQPGSGNLKELTTLQRNLGKLPARHKILLEDINPKFLEKIFLKTYEEKPKSFEALLGMKNVGAKTLRAFALIGDLVYGKPVSFRDPARFSFAHGGKDGYPYKINIEHYQNTIDVLTKALFKANIEHGDRIKALRRVHGFYDNCLNK